MSPCRARRASLSILALATFVMVPAWTAAWAVDENETVGFQTNHLFESGAFGENIDILNGGVNLSIPIGPKYQVGPYITYQLQLAYGSKIWDHTTPGFNAAIDKLMGRSNMGLGFRLNMGRIYKDVEKGDDAIGHCMWYFVTPDGNQHPLPDPGSCGAQPSGPSGYVTTDTTYYSVDGLSLVDQNWHGTENNAPTLSVYTSDGRLQYELAHFIQVAGMNQLNSTIPNDAGYSTNHNRDFGGWYVTKIIDRQSSGTRWVAVEYETAVGYTHAIHRIHDSLGRQIIFTNECAPATSPATGCQQVSVGPSDLNRVAVRTTAISIPAFKPTPIVEDPTVTTAIYRFVYQWRAINNVDSLGCGDANNCPQSSANILTEIQYPEFSIQGGGVQPSYRMRFGYEDCGATDCDPLSNPGLPLVNGQKETLKNGEIWAREIPTGAVTAYAWGIYYYNTGDTRQTIRRSLYRSIADMKTSTYVPPGEWLYARESADSGTSLTNPKWVTVTDPVGNDTVYQYRGSGPDPNTGPPPAFPDYDNGYTPEWDDGANVRIDYYSGKGVGRHLVRSEFRDYEGDTDLAGKHLGTNLRTSRVVTHHADDDGREAVTQYREWNNAGLWRETIESGTDIEGARTTRTQYRTDSGDSTVFDYREVSDGFHVLERTDNEYDAERKLIRSIDRMLPPTAIATSVDLNARTGDLVTAYTYDTSTDEPTQKDVTNGTTSYRIGYGWSSAGYLLTKKFANNIGGGTYFGWFAIDRTRDGNTGLIYKSRDTAQVETNYSYDALGRLTQITPGGQNGSEEPTSIQYTSITRTAVRQGPGSSYDCTPGTTGNFILACYEYDTFGRLVKTEKRSVDPSKIALQLIRYNILGWKEFESEWVWTGQYTSGSEPGTIYDFGDPATYGGGGVRPLDPFGRPRTVVRADSTKSETSYFGTSTSVTVRDVRRLDESTFNATSRYTEDVWGRLVDVTAPPDGGGNAHYTYNLRGNLIEAEVQDPSSLATQVRRFEYDPLGRLRVSENPESGYEVITGYDALGNVTASDDAAGNTRTSLYDGAGRLTSMSWQAYQPAGGPAAPVVEILSNSYDDPSQGLAALGKLTSTKSFDDQGSVVYKQADGTPLPVSSRNIYYLGLNGRISEERSVPAEWPSATPAILSYHYDTLGLLDSTTYPEGPLGKGGAFGVAITNTNGFPEKVRDTSAAPNVYLAVATYNAASGVDSIVLPAGAKTTITSDEMNRPKRITGGVLTGTNWTYDSGEYKYDGAGNIYKMLKSNLLGADRSNNYGYDAANRLVGAKVWDPYDEFHRQSFTYDAFGNMTTKIGYNISNEELTHDEFMLSDLTTVNRNRILSHQQIGWGTAQFQYDARGNVIIDDSLIYQPDSQNRMAAIQVPGYGAVREITRSFYDGTGQRVRKDEEKRGTNFYVRDAGGRLMSEFRRSINSTSVPEWVGHQVYLGDRLVALRENQVPQSPVIVYGEGWSDESTVGYIDLQWNAVPAGEGAGSISYKIYRSPNTVPYNWTLRGTSGIPWYTDTITPSSQFGTYYRYVVTAADNLGRESYPSDPLVARVSMLPLPPSPTGIAARLGDHRITVTWTRVTPADTFLGYDVYRSLNGGPWTLITYWPIRENRFVDQGQTLVGLTDGSYRYAVVATHSGRTSAMSTATGSMVVSDFAPPAPPLDLKAIAACDGTTGVVVSWEFNLGTDGAVTYTVYRQLGQNAPIAVCPNVSTNSCNDTTTAENTEYTYWVVATDGSNSSMESLHSSVRTRAPNAVAAPDRPYAEGGDGIVKVRVPVSSYDQNIPIMRIYRKPNSEPGCDRYQLVKTVNRDTPMAGDTDASVANAVAYDYVATNVKKDGSGMPTLESAFSQPALALPVGGPWGYTECIENLGGNVANWKDGARLCDGVTPDALHPFRRLVMRWRSPTAAVYQPLSSTNASGVTGYLNGFRLYQSNPTATLPSGYDGVFLGGSELESEKLYCSNHPDVSCWDASNCPTGDTCVGLFSSGTCEHNGSQCNDTCDSDGWSTCVRKVGRCVHATPVPCLTGADCIYGEICGTDNVCVKATQADCGVDSDCDAGWRCAYLSVAPYAVRFQDEGANEHVRWYNGDDDGGACMTVTAVHEVFANGMWRTVESGYADNYDASDPVPISRCWLGNLDVCEDLETDPGMAAFYCPAPDAAPPRPTTPVATQTTNGLSVTWGLQSYCQPAQPEWCLENYRDCLDSAKYCRHDIPDGPAGHCYYRNPSVSCTTAAQCQGTETCDDRSGEVAGYYVYAEAPKSALHHSRPNVPIAAIEGGTTTFSIGGLSRTVAGTTLNELTFRVASVDRLGRISEASAPSSLLPPLGGGGAVPAPASVRTVIWKTYDDLLGKDGIKVTWLPGDAGPALAGYRLWRSEQITGTYCALIPMRDAGTGVVTVQCKSASALSPSEVTTVSTGFTDGTVVGGVTYFYAVTSVDTFGAQSAYSSAVAGAALPHVGTPISPPERFKAFAPKGYKAYHLVTEWDGIYLQWCPNPVQEQVTEYRVYRSTTPLGPYSDASLLARVRPECLDGRHRCEITASYDPHLPGDPGLVPSATDCLAGMAGTCKVLDKKGVQAASDNNQPIYYYVVTAVRVVGGVTKESAFSKQNQGRPNYLNGTTHGRVYDPDNFPDVPCGDEISRRDSDEPGAALADNGESAGNGVPPQELPVDGPTSDSQIAPYRIIGVVPPAPNAVTRFLFHHLDHLGTARVITDANGAVISQHHYMPFGEELPFAPQASTNKRQFTGHERDSETGLDYMLARYYSSSLGRFLGVDPGDDTNRAKPQTWNSYAYARNNPLLFKDGTGLEIEVTTLAGWGHYACAVIHGGPLVQAELAAHDGPGTPRLTFGGNNPGLKPESQPPGGGRLEAGRTTPQWDSSDSYSSSTVEINEQESTDVCKDVLHEMGEVNWYRTHTRAEAQERHKSDVKNRRINNEIDSGFVADDQRMRRGERPKKEWKGALDCKPFTGGAPTPGARVGIYIDHVSVDPV
jgi:RHS repeat-associated protein